MAFLSVFKLLRLIDGYSSTTYSVIQVSQFSDCSTFLRILKCHVVTCKIFFLLLFRERVICQFWVLKGKWGCCVFCGFHCSSDVITYWRLHISHISPVQFNTHTDTCTHAHTHAHSSRELRRITLKRRGQIKPYF